MSLDYRQEAIDQILRGSSKQLMRLLDLVKMTRETLESVEHLIEEIEGALNSHLRNLTRIRQVLKKVVERQRVPSYMEEFLLEAR